MTKQEVRKKMYELFPLLNGKFDISKQKEARILFREYEAICKVEVLKELALQKSKEEPIPSKPVLVKLKKLEGIKAHAPEPFEEKPLRTSDNWIVL